MRLGTGPCANRGLRGRRGLRHPNGPDCHLDKRSAAPAGAVLKEQVHLMHALSLQLAKALAAFLFVEAAP